jgi:hypothetical protein
MLQVCLGDTYKLKWGAISSEGTARRQILTHIGEK